MQDSHPLGHISEFHRIVPIPDASSFPWREHASVRPAKSNGVVCP